MRNLAIDLSGIHQPAEESIQLDALAESFNLQIGESYALDLFQAERKTTQSNFPIEASLDFTDCGESLLADIPATWRGRYQPLLDQEERAFAEDSSNFARTTRKSRAGV